MARLVCARHQDPHFLGALNALDNEAAEHARTAFFLRGQKQGAAEGRKKAFLRRKKRLMGELWGGLDFVRCYWSVLPPFDRQLARASLIAPAMAPADDREDDNDFEGEGEDKKECAPRFFSVASISPRTLCGWPCVHCGEAAAASREHEEAVRAATDAAADLVNKQAYFQDVTRALQSQADEGWGGGGGDDDDDDDDDEGSSPWIDEWVENGNWLEAAPPPSEPPSEAPRP